MSDRTLHASTLAALASSTLYPAMMFEGEFVGGWVRLWTGVGDLSYGGNTYLGVGAFLSCSSIDEGEGTASRGVQVSLTATSSLVSAALGSVKQGATGRVYLAFFDNLGVMQGTPVQAFAGRLDVPEISRAGDRCTVSISYEDELVDLERARIRRYTPEDQALTDPTDRGFEFVTALQDASVVWGSSR